MKIFIGGSSSNNIDKKYLEENKKLLDLILQENDLVFGACNGGIMGLAYNSAINYERQIIGISQEAYKDNFKSLKCTKEIVTSSTLEKTKKLIDESDLLLFLPGGIETYFELFSAIESKRCQEFNKPIIIFNLNNFFDKFIEMMDHNYKEAFSKQVDFLNYTITNNIGDTIKCCKNYSNLHTPVNYKIVYEYGLILLKDSLSEVSGLSYQSILPYFNYSLSIIEDNVKKAKYNKTDTNEFYKEQSDKLLEMYGRFLKTCLICKSQVGTREEKMEANEIINSIISQSENLNIGDEIAQYAETNGQVSCAKTLKK